MQSSKVRVVLVCGAGVLAVCLFAGFRVVSAAEVTLVTREVSLGKLVDGAIPYGLAVSLDGKRVAYVAMSGANWLAVVDGAEGNEYDGFLKGSRLVFDSPSQLHTLAFRGDKFLRVEVKIIMPGTQPSGTPRPRP
jgi:hypothetical protein